MANLFRSVLASARAILQSKTVTAGTSAQTVTPDTGYDGFESVTVNPTPSQSKSATPTTSSQTITPDSGKLLSSVSVGAIPSLSGDAAAGNVLSGKTFYNNSYTKQTGSMTNHGNFTGDVDPSSSLYELDPGYYSGISLDVSPHTAYSPSSSTYTELSMGETKQVDLGAHHKYRYIRVRAAAPSGTKSITSNGNVDVSSFATANVNVPNPTLSGDAALGNVLNGKTFYNNDYTKRTGTMPNNGAVSPTALSAGGSYTVPEGYHNGNGVVSAKTLASQTGVDSGKTAIDASHVLSGYQGWVNGNKINGTYIPSSVIFLGYGTKFNVSSFTSEYASLSENNFIVGIAEVPQTTKTGNNDHYNKKAQITELLPIPSYDPSTGILTILNHTAKLKLGGDSYLWSANVPCTCFAYVVIPQGKYFNTNTTVDLLWQNITHTSSVDTIDIQPIYPIDNYDYLKFTWEVSSENNSVAEIIIPTSDFNNMATTNIPVVLTARISSTYYHREITCLGTGASKEFKISSATKYDSTTSNTTNAIPREISGIKGSLIKTRTTKWTNNSPTSSFAAQTITLSSDISLCDAIEIEFRPSINNSSTSRIIIPISQLTKMLQTTASPWWIGLHTFSYGRSMKYVSSTQLSFGDAKILTKSTVYNSWCIPTKINALYFH